MPSSRRRPASRTVLGSWTVATHSQLREAGVHPSTTCRRMRPGGPWQWILPGVVLSHTGSPTAYERRTAAQLYAGHESVLTGADALVELGVTAAAKHVKTVHVLVPHRSQRSSHGFATITRCRDLPEPVERRGLRCAPVARALVDACRRLTRLDDVRELVAVVVQSDRVSLSAIGDEIRRAARQRSGLLREVLDEMDAGVRSVAEARLRATFLHHGVPEPLWNRPVETSDGTRLCTPDALWSDVWLALQLDSMAWHLSPAAYRRTQRAQRALVLHGVEVIPVAPADVLDDPHGLCRAIITKLGSMTPRTLPLIVRDLA